MGHAIRKTQAPTILCSRGRGAEICSAGAGRSETRCDTVTSWAPKVKAQLRALSGARAIGTPRGGGGLDSGVPMGAGWGGRARD